MTQCWLERKERRPTFTELRKDIVAMLVNEGCEVDIDEDSIYF